MTSSKNIVTLLSDFGLLDQFVAVMKGVMLSLNSNLNFVDISHTIPPQDIATGAFILGQSYEYFPGGTTHLAVVDPGVGTSRKAIAVSAGGHIFVAPDNGLLTYVFKRHPDFEAIEIRADHYFRKPVSSTFHGRDIFAPIAAWISRDIPLHQLGTELKNPVMLKVPEVTHVSASLIQAAVLAVDHFGNLVTNLHSEDLPVFEPQNPRPCKILAGKKEIISFKRTFGEGASGELFVVPGSTGYLEIAVRNGSASEELDLKAGSHVGVVIT